jgi:transcription antitermination factor NusG
VDFKPGRVRKSAPGDDLIGDSDDMANPAWYVAAVQRSAEGRARAGLEREPLSFKCALPVQRYLRSREGRTVEEVEICFPGYIFVFFDIDRDPWRYINGTRGVIKLLPISAERPFPLADPVVKQWLAESIIDERRNYVRGDRVEITEGTFEHRVGVVQEVLAHEKIKIWLAGLGGSVVDVSASATRLAS